MKGTDKPTDQDLQGLKLLTLSIFFAHGRDLDAPSVWRVVPPTPAIFREAAIMKFFKSLLATTLLAVAALSQPALAQTAPGKNRLQVILERGTLRVGTTGDFNPMSIRDAATNSYRGFDIEAME